MDKLKKALKRIYYCTKYNNIKLSNNVDIGKHSHFEGHNKIFKNTIFPGEIGYGSTIGSDCSLYGIIGRYCSIGSRVNVAIYNHPTQKFVSTHPSFYSVLGVAGFSYVSTQKFDEYLLNKDNVPLTIGNDVWIGSDVVIIGGVTIGNGAVIGAGSVVKKDIPPYAIYAGVPAHLIRYRFEPEQISELLRIQWWNRNRKWLREHENLFEDITLFLETITKEEKGDIDGK